LYFVKYQPYGKEKFKQNLQGAWDNVVDVVTRLDDQGNVV
jgi:hypothetical protein